MKSIAVHIDIKNIKRSQIWGIPLFFLVFLSQKETIIPQTDISFFADHPIVLSGLETEKPGKTTNLPKYLLISMELNLQKIKLS